MSHALSSSFAQAFYANLKASSAHENRFRGDLKHYHSSTISVGCGTTKYVFKRLGNHMGLISMGNRLNAFKCEHE